MKKLILGIIVGLVVAPMFVYGAFETTVNNPNPIYTGNNATSTTATSYTLVSGDILGYSTIQLTPNTGALTITLPASSTLSSWLPNAGNNLVINLFNPTTTPAATITLAAGTGSLLASASSTKVTYPGTMTEIRVMRKANTDLLFTIYPSL